MVELPSYAPDLNPQECIWPLLKRDLVNLAAQTFGELLHTVKRKLKSLQHRPKITDGHLAGTGLTHETTPTENAGQKSKNVNNAGISRTGKRRNGDMRDIHILTRPFKKFVHPLRQSHTPCQGDGRG
ncbi:hypothetical protein AB0420_07445 [Streptomyces caelestis]|uniref:hypothetical protein n=1 Tax=Streptomyces TaxID=1883 RepID=UPI0018FEF27B|nr:hypothetical protein [Streptomyces sp. XY152]